MDGLEVLYSNCLLLLSINILFLFQGKNEHSVK